MRWQLDNPNARQIIEDYQRFEQEVPESLVPPALSDIEIVFWDSFWELCTERTAGLQPGPIPGSAIRKYCKEETGLNPVIFSQAVRAMDDAYLTHRSGESKTFSRDMMRG